MYTHLHAYTTQTRCTHTRTRTHTPYRSCSTSHESEFFQRNHHFSRHTNINMWSHSVHRGHPVHRGPSVHKGHSVQENICRFSVHTGHQTKAHQFKRVIGFTKTIKLAWFIQCGKFIEYTRIIVRLRYTVPEQKSAETHAVFYSGSRRIRRGWGEGAGGECNDRCACMWGPGSESSALGLNQAPCALWWWGWGGGQESGWWTRVPSVGT